MCGNCGCETQVKSEKTDKPSANIVEVHANLKSNNDSQAIANRALFDAHNVLVINLMSSPGSGKTRLLEETIRALKSQYAMAVIEGDLETENDANRIRRHGVQAEQIATGQGCHLDASMVRKVLGRFSLQKLDVLFIENVGNLICPACFDLGQHLNIILLSVPEGDDKPEKYPVMFRTADVMLISKTDYLQFHDEFNVPRAIESFRKVGNDAPVLEVSSLKSQHLERWFSYFTHAITAHQSQSLQNSGV